jgi:predicted transporter
MKRNIFDEYILSQRDWCFMERSRALTVYLIIPCFLYIAAFAIGLIQFSDVVDTSTLRLSHSIFAAVMAVVLLVKRDELSADS